MIVPALFILGMGTFLLRAQYKFTCQIDSTQCPQSIVDRIESNLHHPVWIITRHINVSLRELLPSYSVRVSLELPKTITVTIRTPESSLPVSVYQIPNLSSSLATLASQSALVDTQYAYTQFLSQIQSSSADHVYLDGHGNLSPSLDRIDNFEHIKIVIDSSDVINLGSIYQLVQKLEFFFKETNFLYVADSLYIATPNEPLVVVSVSKSIEATMQQISYLSLLKKTKQNPQVVDLRYENPILK